MRGGGGRGVGCEESLRSSPQSLISIFENIANAISYSLRKILSDRASVKDDRHSWFECTKLVCFRYLYKVQAIASKG